MTFSATSGIIEITVSCFGNDYKISHNFAASNSFGYQDIKTLSETNVEFVIEITYYDGYGLTVTPV